VLALREARSCCRRGVDAVAKVEDAVLLVGGRRGAVGPSFRSLYETAPFKVQICTRVRGVVTFDIL